MNTGAPDRFDIVLIGSGLGATACACKLARAGKRVAFVPGIGRSRSLDSDGGLILPEVVEDAFGPGAPLGPVISRQQPFVAANVESAPECGHVEDMTARRSYRRLELEQWALDLAIDAGALFFSNFVEGHLLPGDHDDMKLTEEGGDRVLRGDVFGLCEGSDPRIPMRIGLRPDYAPEEQLHFARTIIARQADDPVLKSGETRTRWGMPIRVSVVPLGGETQVSVVARIENIMRSSHSSRDALEDVLASPLGNALGVTGARRHTGVELVSLRQGGKVIPMSHGRILVGVDASGLPDPREVQRADVAIQGGMHLATSLLQEGSGRDWQDRARSLIASMRAREPRWHESRSTGFIEEGPDDKGLVNTIGRIGRGLRKRRHGT